MNIKANLGKGILGLLGAGSVGTNAALGSLYTRSEQQNEKEIAVNTEYNTERVKRELREEKNKEVKAIQEEADERIEKVEGEKTELEIQLKAKILTLEDGNRRKEDLINEYKNNQARLNTVIATQNDQIDYWVQKGKTDDETIANLRQQVQHMTELYNASQRASLGWQTSVGDDLGSMFGMLIGKVSDLEAKIDSAQEGIVGVESKVTNTNTYVKSLHSQVTNGHNN